MDQLERVIAFTGPPNQNDIECMNSTFTQTMLSNLSYTKPRFTLEEKLEGAPPDAIDLVKRLVCFNPEDRLSAEQCLEHEYVAQFHAPDKEISASEKITLVLGDKEKHSIRDYRSQIYREWTSPSDGSAMRRQRSTKGHEPSTV
jgi:mitogen-activated protein kinase 15